MTRLQSTTSDAKPTLTPKLRFREFRDGPGWEDKALDDVCSHITQGGTPDTTVPEYWNGSINWLTPAEMGKSVSPNIHTTERKITEEGLQNCSSDLLPMNSVIISTRAPIGHLAINRSPTAINQGCKGLIPDGQLNYIFLYYTLLSNKTRLKDLGAGNTFKELSGSALKAFGAPFPRPAEQQKIAECLNSLDGLIGAESQKLDALKAHKKGLMQQLFPREGETLPRLRFPEFKNVPEWTAVPLGDLLSRNPEYGVNAPAAPYSKILPTYLRITDIDDDGRYLSKSKVSVDIVATEENYLSEGDIVLARTGASVGKSYRYRKADGRLVFAGFLIRIRPNPKKADPVFLANFLTTNQYWDWVRATSTRSGQPGLNGSEYASLQVPMPPSGKEGLAEQQRIATCLSSLDDLIAAQSDKLEALRTHKQGLMQQLFPSPSEAEA